MCYFFETERVSNLGNIPVCLFEKNFCLLRDSGTNYVGGCLPCIVFQNFIQMVHMDCKAFGKIICCS
ncbi:hypothetical protein D3C81_1938540 [compost metagenome]